MLCRESSQQSGIDIFFTGDDCASGTIAARESLSLYRVAQEALHNTVKHSHARRANLQLVSRRGGTRIRVDIPASPANH